MYGPPSGVFTVDATTRPICYGGPINIITLASTDPNYMWQVGTDRVSYVRTEYVSNSIAVDEKNGIYVAIGGSSIAGVGVMRKLVWTGTVLSDSVNDGA